MNCYQVGAVAVTRPGAPLSRCVCEGVREREGVCVCVLVNGTQYSRFDEMIASLGLHRVREWLCAKIIRRGRRGHEPESHSVFRWWIQKFG